MTPSSRTTRSHDAPKAFDWVGDIRRQSGTDQSLIYRSRVDSGNKELDPILRTVFDLWAGRLARELGY